MIFCNCSLPKECFGLPAQRSAMPAQAMPILHSLPSAKAKLYLSLNGLTIPFWGFYTNVITPPFDYVDNVSAVSDIWTRVAEDYAAFNVDVTTENPGNLTDKTTACVSIGGAYTDWYGSAAGGVAYTGGFYSSQPNVAFVFSRSLGNNSKYIAEAASHEAGHLFGLQHQSLWNGNTLVNQYNSGDANWAPIMGAGYYAASTTWTVGRTPSGTVQDDLAILSNSSNGFGYRTGQVTFRVMLPTEPAGIVGGRLKLTVADKQTEIATALGQTEVAGVGNRQDVVRGEFVYLKSNGQQSAVPSIAQIVL